MSNSNKYLEELFEKAREEKPLASFEETTEKFTKSIAEGRIPTIKKLLKDFTFFIVGMILCALVITLYINTEKDKSTSIDNFIKEPHLSSLSNPIQQVESQKVTQLTMHTRRSKIFISPLPAKKIQFNKIEPSEKVNIDISYSAFNSKIPVIARIPGLPMRVTPQVPEIRPIIKYNTEHFLDLQYIQSSPVAFIVNERTTTHELAIISSLAKQANIEYTYVVDLEKDLIREFNADLSIRGSNLASTIQVSVPDEGLFEIKFGWFVNDSGKAIALSENILIERSESRHPLLITISRYFQEIYMNEGLDYIEKNFDNLVKEINKQHQKAYILNSTGYLFLNQDAYDKAIDIFKLNTRLFPEEANVWDSLGEAFYKKGETKYALSAFKKALTIDPKFSSSKSWIRTITAAQD